MLEQLKAPRDWSVFAAMGGDGHGAGASRLHGKGAMDCLRKSHTVHSDGVPAVGQAQSTAYKIMHCVLSVYALACSKHACVLATPLPTEAAL